MKVYGKKLTAALLALVLALGLAACSSKDGDGKDGDPLLSGKVYVPEFIDFDLKLDYIDGGCSDGKNVYIAGSISTETEQTDPATGETYTSYESRSAIYRIPLDGGPAAELENFTPTPIPDGYEGSSNLRSLRAGAEGTLWVTEQIYMYKFDLPEGFDQETGNKWEYRGESEEREIQRQLDSTGNEIAQVDTSGLLEKLEADYIYNSLFDKDGDMFVSTAGKLAVLDPSMNVKFVIEDEQLWGDSLLVLSDGNVGFCCSYNDPATESYGYKVRVIDKAAKGWGEEYILPQNANSAYSGGGDYLFYYDNNDALYGYKKDTGEGERLLSWIDSDINKNDIEFFNFLPDGRVTVMTQNWGSRGGGQKTELAVLTATERSAIPEKATLTYATMGLGYDERTAIIDFNKSSSSYRIEVRDYSEFNTAEDNSAGLTKLNTEIIAGKVPDILCTDGIPLQQYVAKGILEDLWPFIDGDGEISRDTLMENVFKAAEIDGKLYQAFDTFSIRTVMGAKGVVGDRMSWTLADMQEALSKMPEGCALFGQYDTKSGMLNTVMSMNLKDFVNWETGECNFESAEFKSLLEFCSGFSDEIDWNSVNSDDYEGEPSRISSGRQMLMSMAVSDFEDIQMYKAFYGGDISFVGYPQEDGSVGSTFSIYGGLAMSSTCKDKEGAWAFIRRLLLPQFTEEDSESFWGMGGFPTNKSDFDFVVKQAMTPAGYETDENGNQVLDENGNPIEISNSSWSWDGFQIDIMATTQAEYDQVMELYNAVDSLYSYDQNIYDIVTDVAGSYFSGDRSLDETASQIQSRVKLYINENR